MFKNFYCLMLRVSVDDAKTMFLNVFYLLQKTKYNE